MYLIRDDPEVILFYDRCNTLKLFLRPDTSCRILRIAPEEQLALRIGTELFKVFIVNGKISLRILF